VVASGDGDIPERIDLSAAAPATDLALQPGQSRTVWLVFAPLEGDDDPGRRRIHIPVRNAEELAFTIRDDECAPVLDIRQSGRMVLGATASIRHFGGATGDGVYPDVFGLWLGYQRGAWMANVIVEGTRLIDTRDERVTSVNAGWVSLDLAWMPRHWFLGPHATAHVVTAPFENTAFGPHARLYGASLGLLWRLRSVWPSIASIRLDYTHLFGAGPRSHGVTLGIDVLLL
jgi:hypothetical protein